MLLNDDAFKIVLNTACDLEKVPERLRAFYAYVRDPSHGPGSELCRRIDEEVRKYNSPDWRRKQMTFEYYLNRQHEEGLREGRKEGEKESMDRIKRLGERLHTDGRDEEVVKAVTDLDYQKKLMEEYGI